LDFLHIVNVVVNTQCLLLNTENTDMANDTASLMLPSGKTCWTPLVWPK